MGNASELSSATNADLERVAEQMSERLLRLGIFVHNNDSAEDLATITEAVERFEASVEASGGDLMVDEPPAGHAAQPDNVFFALPVRTINESAAAFASRIDAATARVRA